MPILKKIFLIAACCFFQQARAQLDSLQTSQLRKSVLDSLCHCISRIDTINFKGAEEVEEQVAACYTSYDKELLMLYVSGSGKKWSKDSEAQFKKFVSSLGVQVYDSCKSMRAVNSYLRSGIEGKKEF